MGLRITRDRGTRVRAWPDRAQAFLAEGLYRRVGTIGSFAGACLELLIISWAGVWTLLLLFWDVVAIVYLVMTWAVFHWIRDDRARDLEAYQERWGFAMVTLAATSALAAAIVALPQINKFEQTRPELLLILAIVAIATAWLVTHTAFAVHYAYLYHRGEQPGGLRFPETSAPGFVDFVYFACSVGTTFGTTDVEVTSTEFRRTVVRHGLLSFLFNTAILALTVSFIGNYFGK